MMLKKLRNRSSNWTSFLFFTLNCYLTIIKQVVEMKKLDENFIRELSAKKKEPEWMLNFRLQSYQEFLKLKQPNFGPKLDINFDDILYYKKDDVLQHDWKNVKNSTYQTFCQLGVVDAENKYLDGVSNQLESEVVYHKNNTNKDIIFMSTDQALQEHPDLFQKYFNTLVDYKENK